MPDPLESSRGRLARARTHVKDFKKELDAYWDFPPYYRLVDKDADSRYELYKFKFRKPLPSVLTDLAWDTIQNLRAVLDLAGHGLALASGKIKPLNTYFPFAPNVKDFVT